MNCGDYAIYNSSGIGCTKEKGHGGCCSSEEDLDLLAFDNLGNPIILKSKEEKND